jgi:hypothetical protein
MLAGNTAEAGGGAIESVLDGCVIVSNSAASYAGGAQGLLRNCVIAHNSANYGAGVNGTAINCTIVGNTANVRGGGAYESDLFNSIVFYNSAPTQPDVDSCGLFYCCTTLHGGSGNITNAPAFVDQAGGNFRLQTNSACVNAGRNAYLASSTDVDGGSRIAGGTVDIGAYELPSPASILSVAWLLRYGLPADGSADYSDSDHDGMNNWQEWRADTHPVNAASRLQMHSPTGNGTTVTVVWESVDTRSYWLERASDLGTFSFQVIQSNIVGQAGITLCSDTNVMGASPFFYRVGVHE